VPAEGPAPATSADVRPNFRQAPRPYDARFVAPPELRTQSLNPNMQPLPLTTAPSYRDPRLPITSGVTTTSLAVPSNATSINGTRCCSVDTPTPVRPPERGRTQRTP